MGVIAGTIMARRASNIARNLWTVDLLHVKEDHQILEIGCGPGLALKRCAERVVLGRVVGLDHSQTMIRQAQKLLSKEIAAGKIELRLGGLDSLRRSSQAFDRVFSLNVVQFFPDLAEAFKLIYESLKEGGVAITTYQPRTPKASRQDALSKAEEIEQAMRNAGFVDIERHELPLKPVPVVSLSGVRRS